VKKGEHCFDSPCLSVFSAGHFQLPCAYFLALNSHCSSIPSFEQCAPLPVPLLIFKELPVSFIYRKIDLLDYINFHLEDTVLSNTTQGT